MLSQNGDKVQPAVVAVLGVFAVTVHKSSSIMQQLEKTLYQG